MLLVLVLIAAQGNVRLCSGVHNSVNVCHGIISSSFYNFLQRTAHRP